MSCSVPTTTPAAIIRLRPAEADETELFRAIPRRHTDRGAYVAGRGLPDELVATMRDAASDFPGLRLYLLTGRDRQALASLVVASAAAIVNDPQMSRDNAQWFRFSRDAVDECRDGLTLDANVTKPLARFAAKLFPPSAERADRHWLKDTEDIQLATASLLGIIAVRHLYGRPTSLLAGRLWQRLHLLLTARELSAQPLNQPVEGVDREQLEQPPRTAEAPAHITGDAEWRPTFIFRAGYPRRPPGMSPRRPIEAIVSGGGNLPPEFSTR